MIKKKAKKILFVTPYPYGKAPSQRFRFELFFPYLEEGAWVFDTASFIGEKTWAILYKPGHAAAKVAGILKGFLKRLLLLFSVPSYDIIFIHREATPIGPPWFEWMVAKVLRKKIIYDFDDAIWIPNVTASNKIVRYIKCFWKVRHITKWAHKISAGNAYLAEWAAQYNRQAFIVPTCVDTENRFSQIKEHADGRVSIGWTGTHSTLPYLNPLVPVLQRLQNEKDFEFIVICNQPPLFSLKNLTFIKWQEATEIEDLAGIDIGVMPLEADAWSEGKCGFKLIQYLALGIPAVASPVGVNSKIIESGGNGYLCTTAEEWYISLKELLDNAGERQNMGESGRQKIVSVYSVQANVAGFISLFS